jgi:hypothetical protein
LNVLWHPPSKGKEMSSSPRRIDFDRRVAIVDTVAPDLKAQRPPKRTAAAKRAEDIDKVAEVRRAWRAQPSVKASRTPSEG